MAVVLLIKTSDGTIIDVPMFGSTIIIGRSSRADIKLDDKMISSKHCSVELKNNQLLFKDLTSTNGSFLNNSKIHETRIRIGDRIHIGESQIYIDESKLSSKEKENLSANRSKQAQEVEMTGISQKNISDILKKDSTGKSSGGIPKISPKKKSTPRNQEEEESKSSGIGGFLKKLLGKK